MVLRGLKRELRTEHMLIITLLVAIVASLYGLHAIETALITFSEDGDIVGDGGGPYVDGVTCIRMDTHLGRGDCSNQA